MNDRGPNWSRVKDPHQCYMEVEEDPKPDFYTKEPEKHQPIEGEE